MKKLTSMTHSETTQSPHFDCFNEPMLELITNFLSENYVLGKVKVKTKFKKGIIVNGVILLYPRNKDFKNYVKNKLKLFYDLTESECDLVFNHFYGWS